MRTVYHGSTEKVSEPKFGFDNRYNDFGAGFYCTDDPKLAEEWAVRRDRDGRMNAYRIDESRLEVMDLCSRGYTVLNWLAILLENRSFDVGVGLAREAREYLIANFATPYRSADVIVGWRADDSGFSFAQDFLAGEISYSQLRTALRVGNLGRQYVLKSERAFKAIGFSGATRALRGECLARKEARDLIARRKYLAELVKNRQPGDLRIGRIIDEGIRSDDKRL